jgi:DNA replication and repair protein RecF
VEPSFLEQWKAFRRGLEQRNALLRGRRGSPAEFDLWEAQLAAAARAVDAARRASVEALAPRFDEVLEALGGPEGVSLHYVPGWDPESPLEEQLARSRDTDREAGFTRAGPQRADLRILARGRRASEIISRGQQKLVACALLVAQGHQLEAGTDKRGVYLVDDLPAELDAEHRYRLGRSLAGMKGQVLVTAVQRDLVLDGLAEADELAMFHVEHGRVTRA